jgi:endonuclease G
MGKKRLISALFVSALIWASSWAVGSASASDLCLGGCPVGASSSNTTITRSIYVLSNNPRTKFADWVAYRVTRETIGKSKQRNWKADPDLPASQTLEPSDYDGAPMALKIDRGHQAPLAAFSGTADWSKTNYLSNITPQSSQLNQGPWEKLEAAEIRLAQQPDVTAVFVVTGPLNEHPTRPLPNADEPHTVPSAYWKVVAIQSASGVATASFLMHQTSPRGAVFCNYAVTISEVERRSQTVLFPEISAETRRQINERPDALLPALGCDDLRPN